MEFEIICPVDGAIQVSLEDIETVVLREPEHADITFVCPHCGTEVTVAAVVPHFLLAAIEAIAESDSVSDHASVMPAVSEVPVIHLLDEREEAYCEYFRRQLSHVVNAEDAIAEIDSKAGR